MLGFLHSPKKREDHTADRLFAAWQYCDDKDKSTEFMIEYMQDFANVAFDGVMSFIENTTSEERKKWLKDEQLREARYASYLKK